MIGGCVDRAFAAEVAGMIWADLHDPDGPFVGSGLPDGRDLSFSDMLVGLYGEDGGDSAQPPQDYVLLDALAEDEAAARKLASWLGLLLEGESGMENFGSGWSAWAERSDGQVLEVAAWGYQLYKTKQGFLAGDQCIAAHRGKAVSSKKD